jgi:arabinose-5-phosphate isomerase
MLALGDALAVAMMARRGFTADSFRDFHPRGSLGRRLAKVSDLMHADPPVVRLGTRMAETVLEITAKRFGCTAVIDADGKLAGIVTDGDLRRHMGADLLTLTVDKVMTRNPLSVAPDALALEALATMNARQVTALLVCAESEPVGIVHIHDLLREGVA